MSFDLITGGWEWENFDVSLLDFGHVELAGELKDGQLSIGAFASAWSPSTTISFLGIGIE